MGDAVGAVREGRRILRGVVDVLRGVQGRRSWDKNQGLSLLTSAIGVGINSKLAQFRDASSKRGYS